MVTGNYAGMFFRAEGDESNKFEGGVQEASSPRLISVKDKDGQDTGYVDIVRVHGVNIYSRDIIMVQIMLI